MNKKPVILFESYPDFTGSPIEIYNELVRRGYDKKYDMVWAVYSTFNEKTKYKVVKYFGCNSPEKQNILARTKIIIDSNRYVQKPRPDVFRLHTRHGTNLKKVLRYSATIGEVNAILTTSKLMASVDKEIYPESVATKDVILGCPANDKLFEHIDLYKCGFIKALTNSDNHFSKIIGWFPTYRQHRGNPLSGSPKVFPFGLPCIDTIDDAYQIDAILKRYNILVLAQMHHAQAKNYKPLPPLSNLKFISDDFLDKFKLPLFSILNSCDALITDYSSIYFEYLLLNRPVGTCVSDLLYFNRSFGFCFSYLQFVKGVRLLTASDICNFIIDVSNGKDETKDERTELLNKIHLYKDNQSTRRVVDFLIPILK